MISILYIHTRACLCPSAHREERWIWSEVATILSGSDPTVLSQTLSQIRSQNTITNSITTSIERESGHYRRVETIVKRERGSHDLTKQVPSLEKAQAQAAHHFFVSLSLSLYIYK